jgi:hypothetical protein
MRTPLLAVVAVVAWPLAACGDPVRQSALDALGGETNGVPKGPLHRGGQPCLLCHGGEGPGNTVFSLAGTVYQTPSTKIPLANALVKVIDATGKEHEAGTNCAGNFFIMRADYEPSYPVWTKLEYGFTVLPSGAHQPISQPMGSPIYREGSCGKCHEDATGAESPGRVYFAPNGFPFPAEACPQ